MRYIEGIDEDFKKSVESIVNYERLYNKSVLITGAGGMIGSAIVDLLMFLNRYENANIKIIAGMRHKSKYENRFKYYSQFQQLEFMRYDAVEKFAINQTIDYIIHSAGNASPIMYASNPVEVMETNFIGMKSILEYAKEHKQTKVIYLSSSEVYGRTDNRDPLLEDEYGDVDILNSRMCYASSKRATETLCISYLKEYGVRVCIVRPGHIFGPTVLSGDTKASTLFGNQAKAGNDIILKSNGLQIRSYCYVFDCASAILQVAISGIDGMAYNISNKNSICSIRQLAEVFSSCSGTKVVFENPKDLEKEVFNPMDNSSLNSEKLESLGWKGAFNLRDGVAHTLKYLDEEEI